MVLCSLLLVDQVDDVGVAGLLQVSDLASKIIESLILLELADRHFLARKDLA